MHYADEDYVPGQNVTIIRLEITIIIRDGPDTINGIIGIRRKFTSGLWNNDILDCLSFFIVMVILNHWLKPPIRYLSFYDDIVNAESHKSCVLKAEKCLFWIGTQVHDHAKCIRCGSSLVVRCWHTMSLLKHLFWLVTLKFSDSKGLWILLWICVTKQQALGLEMKCSSREAT